MIIEAANFYLLTEGKTLVDILEDIYKQYGYYYEGLSNIHLLGKEGQEKIGRIMSSFRKERISKILDLNIVKTEDFLLSKRYFDGGEEMIDLEKSDVLKYYLEDESWFVLRPSGTEPKLKIYAGVIGLSFENAVSRVNALLKSINEIVEKVD
jgi:phosphomannomutase